MAAMRAARASVQGCAPGRALGSNNACSTTYRTLFLRTPSGFLSKPSRGWGAVPGRSLCAVANCTHPCKLEILSSASAEKLLRQYRAAMKMEVDFFSAQPYKPPPRTINLLVVDFDDTCSASDTTGLIAETAIAAAVKQVSLSSASGWRGEAAAPLEPVLCRGGWTCYP